MSLRSCHHTMEQQHLSKGRRHQVLPCASSLSDLFALAGPAEPCRCPGAAAVSSSVSIRCHQLHYELKSSSQKLLDPACHKPIFISISEEAPLTRPLTGHPTNPSYTFKHKPWAPQCGSLRTRHASRSSPSPAALLFTCPLSRPRGISCVAAHAALGQAVLLYCSQRCSRVWISHSLISFLHSV